VPLNEVAQLTFENSPSAINRFAKNRLQKSPRLQAQASWPTMCSSKLVPQLNRIQMPAGYYYKLAGEAESEDDTFAGGFMTIVIATLFLS